jgi:hypothetical protein
MAKLVRYQHCGHFHFVTFSFHRRQQLFAASAVCAFIENVHFHLSK